MDRQVHRRSSLLKNLSTSYDNICRKVLDWEMEEFRIEKSLGSKIYFWKFGKVRSGRQGEQTKWAIICQIYRYRGLGGISL